MSENKPIGYLYAFLAYFSWGFVPIYWKLIGHIGYTEILGHRIIWAALILGLYLLFTSGFAEFISIFREKKKILALTFSTILIFFNWNLFIWGVTHNFIVECSLGYFINPMINVVLGLFVLKEKMKWTQWPAVILAVIGIIFLFEQNVGHPWISILLALSFALYGLIRKQASVTPATGLFFETVVLVAPIFYYFYYLSTLNQLHTLSASPKDLGFLVGAGFVTVVPLLAFGHAVKNLKLITVGFFQYMTPTIQLFIGVWLYHEQFSSKHALAFGLIWLGLVVYTFGEVWQLKQAKNAKQ